MKQDIPHSGLRKVSGVLASMAVLVLAGRVAFAQDELYLTNVNVLPMDTRRVLENQALIVRDGIIAVLGDEDAVDAPANARHIDGKGGYLMPGLSDMHAHLRESTNWKGAVEPSEVAANQLLLYLATGVTLLRDPAGSPAHFRLQEKLEAGELTGPELHFTTGILEGENAVWDASIIVRDPEEVEPLVTQFAKDGYWGIKIYHTISAAVFDAVMASATQHGLKVIGHVPFEVGIERALAAGMYSVEHLRGYDFDGLSVEQLEDEGGRSALRFSSMNRMSDERMDELIDKTVLSGAWNTPTLAVKRFLFDAGQRAAVAAQARFDVVHPQLQEEQINSNSLDAIFSESARAAMRDVFPRQQEFVRRLYDAGAGVLIGTDATIAAYVPGFTPIDEMQAIAAGGVSTFEVLQSATIKAAESLGIDAECGTVAVGKRASLILLEKNPLTNLDRLWSLRGVLHQGRWLTRADLESMLAAQAAARKEG